MPDGTQALFRRRLLPYLLLLPSIIIVTVFFVIPALQSIELSAYRVHAFTGKRIFVGLENFKRLFESAEYLNSLRITAVVVSFVVFVGLSVSLLLAIGAGQPIKGFGIYRMLLVATYAVSPAAAGVVWLMLADPTVGLLAHGLEHLGIAFNPYTDSIHALLFISVAATWKMLGYNVLFFMAGLRHIPKEILEAASLDGVSGWQYFWQMLYPLLKPTTLFLVVMNTLYAAFQSFGLVDVTTQGGPGGATDLLIYRLYKDGFVNANQIGLAAAQSVTLLVMVTAIVFIQIRGTDRRALYQ
jgi:sn-glycerol 3-phosphate transport system permease protein